MSLTDLVTEFVLGYTTPYVLELGSHSFKLAHGSFQDGQFNLGFYNRCSAAASVTFAPGQKAVISDESNFQTQIKKLFGKNLRSGTYVSLIIPDTAFSYGLLNLSAFALKTNPLGVIEREIQTNSQIPIKDAIYRYEIGISKANKTTVLFSVLPNGVIESVTRALAPLGLIPLSIQPSFFCLAGAMRIVDVENTPHPSVWLHFGNRSTEVGIALNGNLRRIQSLPVGAADFTKALIQAFSTDREHAESYQQNEIILLDEPTSDSQNEVDGYKPLDPLFVSLLQKIYSVLQQHSTEFPAEGAFRHIFLSGGFSSLKNFDKLVFQNFGNPVSRIGALLQTQLAGNPVEAAVNDSLAPILGAIYLKPWSIQRHDRMVA